MPLRVFPIMYAFLACDLKCEIMQCNCALFEKLITVPTLNARKEAFITSAMDHFVATNLTGASQRIRFMFAYWVWMWATSSLPVTQYQIWKSLEPSLKTAKHHSEGQWRVYKQIQLLIADGEMLRWRYKFFHPWYIPVAIWIYLSGNLSRFSHILCC